MVSQFSGWFIFSALGVSVVIDYISEIPLITLKRHYKLSLNLVSDAKHASLRLWVVTSELIS
jgi:hypothetical protein